MNLREIVLRVISWPDRAFIDSSDMHPPDTVAFSLPIGSKVSHLAKKVHGAFDVHNICNYVFCGRLLQEHDIIPSECFETNERLDEVSLIFRPRITMIIISNQFDAAYAPPQDDVVHVHVVQDIDQAEIDRQQREKELYEAQLIAQNNVVVGSSSKFDLCREMQLIECSIFYPALLEAGFGQEGTFANISEADFQEMNLHFPLRAKQRILALAAHVQQNMPSKTATAPLANQSNNSDAGRRRESGVSLVSGSQHSQAPASSGPPMSSHSTSGLDNSRRRSSMQLWDKAKGLAHSNELRKDSVVLKPLPPAVHRKMHEIRQR